MNNEDSIKQYTLIPNNSSVYYNGSTWTNNEGLTFSIIGRTNRIGDRRLFFLCQFEDGTIVEASHSHIYDGQIKHPNHRTIYGIGYFGTGKYQATKNYKKTKEYQLWCRILSCCYNPKNKSYKYYGNKGVTVDESWHNFQQFCEDIQKLENYEKWKEGDGYDLDKDILCEQYDINPKVYSLRTCKFVTRKENNLFRNKQNKKGEQNHGKNV